MSDFTASNGIRISVTRQASDDRVYLLGKGDTIQGGDREWTEATASEDGIAALREFFRHGEDERLGRWRWPENNDFVVYLAPECNTEDELIVMSEASGASVGFARSRDDGRHPDKASYWTRAARAYFDAHPEPKPWHDAKPGETWLLTVSSLALTGATLTFNVIGVEDRRPSRFARPQISGEQMEYPVDSPDITAGRRIWPEDAS